MPLYEYQCEKCGEVIEKHFKISDKPQTVREKCPSCETEETFNYIISSAAISYLGVNHAAKVPSDFKNRMDQIKKHYPQMQSTI